ncbi:MAG: sn-glycerol-1-phosphate dehydrogenase [Oscillospiraceae bacterium]|nr:sn-glycerol-1-phosphate dehydrogenase [Oscillospiraceae bacterium]
MSIENMHDLNGVTCSCGKTHRFDAEVTVGKGVVRRIPEYVRQYHAKKVFVLSDINTFQAAGEQVCGLLEDAGIPFVSYCCPEKNPEPDEKRVGSVVMHYDSACDLIVAIGSGVINDIGKILSTVSGRPYIIVATAPSMDGYASASSSMTRDGLKISLPSRCPDVIIGDTDILCNAPLELMRSGLGDMLAKYVSICEWRLSHLINGEYYCEQIAQLIRHAVKQCVDNAPALLRREEAAVQAVFEGLVTAGVAMKYAGLSRPASGVEHYISHVLDMRGAEFRTPVALHGIQCAVGTVIAVKLYHKLKAIIPDKEKALAYVAGFRVDAWHETLRGLLGKGAESMIDLESREKKYDLVSHASRLETILKNWDRVLRIIKEELPSAQELEALLDAIQAPKTLEELGVSEALLPTVFGATKDIRDKYVLSRLMWDLGIIEEVFL